MAAFNRIFLTGGSGFVGAHLAPLLAADQPKAERVALTLAGDGQTALSPSWSTVCGDLRNPAAIDAVVAALRPDLVVHLAGQASMAKALNAAESTWRGNFEASFNLACALARHAPNVTLLYASSVTVYGESLKHGAARETTPLCPLDAYARSKLAAEYALADVLPPNARLIVARPVNHSGPFQSEKSFVLASFAAQIAAIEAGAEPLLSVGDLSKVRDFLDVRDVVDAYCQLIACADRLDERVSVFNIGSGEAYAIGDLLERLRRRAKTAFDVKVDAGLLRPSGVDIASVVCDASKLRQATGWRPRRSMDDLLETLLDHWREKQKASA